MSDGFSVKSYFGSFMRRETIDFEVCALDADKSIAVELQAEGKQSGTHVSLQFAMLYSTPEGKRKLRIIN